jgi:beta-alanine--pyruvate transaminase
MQYTANTLENHWMPFTANRDFKENPRLLVKGKGINYTNHHGDNVIDGLQPAFSDRITIVV